jgi:transposase
MEVTTIGIDVAKNVFAVRDADGSGRVVMRRQLRRVQVVVNAWAAAPQW